MMVWVDWSDRRTGSVSNKKAWRDRVIRARFRDTPSDGALVLCRGQRVGAASILAVMSRDPRKARRISDGSSTKTPRKAYRFRLGFTAAGAVPPRRPHILVLEDPGGIPLDQILKQPLELTRFLRIAVAPAVALRRLA